MFKLNEYVLTSFHFLEQFGYRILEEKDVNCLTYKGENNQIDIVLSPSECELTCNFTDGMGEIFSLQDALEYGNMKECKGMYQVANSNDIEKGINYLSKTIKGLFEKIDISEPLNFKKIVQFKQSKHKRLLKNYCLEVDLKKAEELFEKNKEYLSLAQLKKLEYIKKRMPD